MSEWAYINGTITVSSIGRTQPEKRYILDSVLEHLPVIEGSERDMDVYVIQKTGYNSHCSCDEFGQITNNLTDSYGQKNRKSGWLNTQNQYIIVVDGSLRDKDFETTYRMFQKWLCRLAKRIMVDDVLVKISGYEKETIVDNSNDTYGKMFEYPSWGKKGSDEPAWYEYLMWEESGGSMYPLKLAYKYFAIDEIDEEMDRRKAFKMKK